MNFESENKKEITNELKASTSADGLIFSLNNLGKVDIPYIARITNKDFDSVISDLKNSLFLDPSKWNQKDLYNGWVTKDEYVSGNIYSKYQEAIRMNGMYPSLFNENIEVLKEAFPDKIPVSQIFITLGTPWIPTKYVEQFAREILRVRKSYYNPAIAHDLYTGSWEVRFIDGYNTQCLYKYGTDKINALKILEKTLNCQNIAVYDSKYVFDPNKGFKVFKKVLNEKETQLAIEKQKLLIETFRKWIWSDLERKEELKNIYFQKFGSYRKRYYDGSFLTFPDLSSDVELFDYQKNAIARIIFSKNALLAHQVGAGKSYEMIAGGHELIRMGLSKKNMYVVPNNILKQWEKFYYKLYPNAKILIVSEKNFKPSMRLATLKEIRDGDYEAIIITYSSFGMIELSSTYYKEKNNDEIAKLNVSSSSKANDTPVVERRLKSALHERTQIKKKYDSNIEDEFEKIYFEDLGITRLFVDESHNFKNVPFFTKTTNILGLNPTGSQKCESMMDKVHYVQKQNNGGGVVFATGTPITNSISDAYTIQRYLQNDELNKLGISNFDSWANMFAEVNVGFEIDVVTTSYRLATRFSKFHNLPELSAILSNVADYHDTDKSSDLPKFNGYNDVIIKKCDEFDEFLGILSKRADDIRNGMPQIFLRADGDGVVKDNMLLITTDGRKAALDLRLIDEEKYKFSEHSKVFECARNVYDIYKEYDDIKATQLIFCDVSTPKIKFNIYSELKHILYILGVPNDEVAFIHDAASDTQRANLFQKVQDGEIRILIGSTFKLGTGVNVQDKLIAIHHIDVPWRPSDMVQREGRLIRPGNTNEEVYIYRYITENSFDAYSWQLLETKQNFISKLLNNEIIERNSDDVDDTVLNYAEVKALAIGNPLIKERVEVYNELCRFRNLQSKSVEKKRNLENKIAYLEGTLPMIQQNIELTKSDRDYFVSLPSIYNKEESEDRKQLRQTIYHGIRRCLENQKEEVITNYKGFDIIGPSFAIDDKVYITLKRTNKYSLEIGNSELGYLVRIDNFLKSLDSRLSDLENTYFKNLHFIEEGKSELERTRFYTKNISFYSNKLAKIDAQLGVGTPKL